MRDTSEPEEKRNMDCCPGTTGKAQSKVRRCVSTSTDRSTHIDPRWIFAVSSVAKHCPLMSIESHGFILTLSDCYMLCPFNCCILMLFDAIYLVLIHIQPSTSPLLLHMQASVLMIFTMREPVQLVGRG